MPRPRPLRRALSLCGVWLAAIQFATPTAWRTSFAVPGTAKEVRHAVGVANWLAASHTPQSDNARRSGRGRGIECPLMRHPSVAIVSRVPREFEQLHDF